MSLVTKHEPAGQSAFHIKVSMSQHKITPDLPRDKDGIHIDPNYKPHVVELHFIDSARLPLGSKRTTAAKATQWVRPD